MNAIKHRVSGNNDEAATGKAAGWASVHDCAELTVEGTLLVLCVVLHGYRPVSVMTLRCGYRPRATARIP